MKLQSALTPALLATVLLSLAACAGSGRERPIKMGPVDTGAGSVVAARKYLEGRWALESFEVYPPGKPPVTLKGQGSLTYDEFSNLAMEIRTDVATSDLLRAAGIDVKGETISMSGRTAVDVPNKTLTYVIQGQPAGGTGPLAASRKRYWQVEGDVLTLTTKDDAGKPTSVGRWKKLP